MIGIDSDGNKPQDAINLACRRFLKRRRPSNGKWLSLEDRLRDCYVESNEGAPKDKRFCHGVRLLEKIVLQDNLSTLVVNLYPRNEGYSLMLKGKNGIDSETVKLPYEVCKQMNLIDLLKRR
ncbi:PREDICTED: transcription factor SPT20 homolog [Acropora digitifera]|uniref:transcription factor SPT20 homolog n=1 Tax=Acropora digitifera TaxID=70779 RepID=UPI000779F865|nr:PREDICTED: transcription factor SPT20 homolog [Acropora digitifera]